MEGQKRLLITLIAILAVLGVALVTLAIWPRQNLTASVKELDAMFVLKPPGCFDCSVVRDDRRPLLPDVIRARQLIPDKIELGMRGTRDFTWHVEFLLSYAVMADRDLIKNPA